MFLRSQKGFLILILTLSLLFVSNFAWAQQGTIQVQKLETQILPEYDTPDILVINTIEFKNTSDQNFTGDLSWRVQKGAKTHIVSDNKNPNNQLQFSLTSEENFDVMTWKLPTPIKPGETTSVHLEYYYNNLQGSPDKTFSFEFIPHYPVSATEVYVIQPIKATNFKLSPDFGQGHKSDEFIFFVKNFFMSPENGIKIDASYTKTDPNPSLAGKQGQTGQGQEQGQAQGFLSSNTTKYLLAAIIGAFILLLIYREIRNRNPREYDEDDEEIEEDEEDEEEEEVELPKARKNKKHGKKEVNNHKEDSNYEVDDRYQEEAKNTIEAKNDEDEQPESSLSAEKRRLEEAFKDGRISESDYLELLAELEEEE